jgi:hypothetical protein
VLCQLDLGLREQPDLAIEQELASRRDTFLRLADAHRLEAQFGRKCVPARVQRAPPALQQQILEHLPPVVGFRGRLPAYSHRFHQALQFAFAECDQSEGAPPLRQVLHGQHEFGVEFRARSHPHGPG